MNENTTHNDPIEMSLLELSKIIDPMTLNKIFNKLTDYAEILTIGKLSGIVNFNYRLNSEQTTVIIDFLIEIQAVSRIHNLAFKGTKDLEDEFVSNIFSDVISPSNISSFISIRNLLENRLTHQIQQYNINMNKSNTTLAMPLNELRGHAKTYQDLSKDNLSISTKAQHGIIAASLHDAYITLIGKNDWWNDRTYMKFFFNEDDPLKRNNLILMKKERASLVDIQNNIERALELFNEIKASKLAESEHEFEGVDDQNASGRVHGGEHTMLLDKMLMTPFGRQYGTKIDTIITDIYDHEPQDLNEELAAKLVLLYDRYETDSMMLNDPSSRDDLISIAQSLLMKDLTVKHFSEKYLYPGRKESFNRFYTDNRKLQIENFITEMYSVFFKEKFKSLFTVIKSPDMKKFACAYTIKRMYMKFGENITRFGYYFIRAMARVGGIKGQ